MKQIQTIQTPDGPLALVLPTAQKLLAEHVITGVLDGELRATDAATVKAAIMASAVCDFCSTPGAVHFYDVPDFSMLTMDGNFGAGKSLGGWMACDTCHALVEQDNRKALVERALSIHAFPKFSRQAVEELYGKFWQGIDNKAVAQRMAGSIVGFVEDTLPEFMPTPPMQARGKRVEAVVRMTGLTPKQIEQLGAGTLDRDTVAKLVKWKANFGKMDPRSLIDLLAGGPKPPLADVTPHWQRALDGRFTALTNLQSAISGMATAAHYFPDSIDLNDPAQVRTKIKAVEMQQTFRNMGFETDAKLLRTAETYSFNGDTIAAIRQAAAGIPHDAPLSSIETPNTGAGWFWFAEPIPVKASPFVSDNIQALLWGWTDDRSEGPSLVFSAYCADEKGQLFKAGTPAPSTRWHWPFSMSFHDMLAYNTASHRRDYGPGSKHEHDPNIMGEAATIHCVSEMSLFFVMACLWFKQTVPVLTKEPGQVERHARKRYVREHKLSEAPTVQVVALRKSLRVPSEKAEGPQAASAKTYHVRWIVKGHPRLQVCGPGRADRKLIWVESFLKGPEEAPLKTKERVYAVIR